MGGYSVMPGRYVGGPAEKAFSGAELQRARRPLLRRGVTPVLQRPQLLSCRPQRLPGGNPPQLQGCGGFFRFAAEPERPDAHGRDVDEVSSVDLRRQRAGIWSIIGR